jgi:hypothetical protein
MKLNDAKEHSIADMEDITGVKRAALFRSVNIRVVSTK